MKDHRHRLGHAETPVFLGLLAVVGLVLGIGTTVARYRNNGGLAWWEWIVGPVLPLGLLILGLILLSVIASTIDRFRHTMHKRQMKGDSRQPPQPPSTDQSKG